MSDKVQSKFYLPEDVKGRVDRDERANSEVVEIALREHYGTRDMSAIEVRIQNMRDELKSAKDTLQSDQERVEELTEEVERLERRKENMNDTEAKETWERAMQRIDRPTLRSIDTEEWQPEADNDVVQHFATELGMTPEEFCNQYPEKYKEFNA